MFSVNERISKIAADLSILFYFQRISILYFIFAFWPFLSKNLLLFSLFKSVSTNNKQIINASLECYTTISCTETYSFFKRRGALNPHWLFSKHDVDKEKKWILAFFKTICYCRSVQDIIATHFAVYERHDFS